MKMEAEDGVIHPQGCQATIGNPGGGLGWALLMKLQRESTLHHLDFRLLASHTVNQFL